MARITMNIQTLDWTMGETVGLYLMLKKGSKASLRSQGIEVVESEQEQQVAPLGHLHVPKPGAPCLEQPIGAERGGFRPDCSSTQRLGIFGEDIETKLSVQDTWWTFWRHEIIEVRNGKT